MPWQCRLVDDPEERKRLREEHGRLPVGTMWHDPELFPAAGTPRPEHGYLSRQYFAAHAGRRAALMVVLPNHHAICLDACATGHFDDGDGWTVTGDAPNVTVSPSINWIGSYHGWLQGGVLSDDCEGRRF